MKISAAIKAENLFEHTLPPRKEIQVDGAVISLIEAGEGEPALLLHGYPQSALMWRHQIPHLAQTNRVIAPDWFGWGLSEKSLHIKPRYWDEVERIAKLLDELGVDHCNLVGHDYGGFLSLGFAIKHPQRVKRLAIINSRAHETFSSSTYNRFSVLAFAARTPLLRLLLERMPVGKMHRTLLQPFVEMGCFDTALAEHYYGWLDSPIGRKWLVNFYRFYELPAREDLAEELANVECPSAIIWGDKDQVCPWSIAVELSEKLPHANLSRIKGGNHYIVEERPDEILKAIQDLLVRVVD